MPVTQAIFGAAASVGVDFSSSGFLCFNRWAGYAEIYPGLVIEKIGMHVDVGGGYTNVRLCVGQRTAAGSFKFLAVTPNIASSFGSAGWVDYQLASPVLVPAELGAGLLTYLGAYCQGSSVRFMNVTNSRSYSAVAIDESSVGTTQTGLTESGDGPVYAMRWTGTDQILRRQQGMTGGM